MSAITETKTFSDDTAEALESAYESFSHQFETSEGGSIRAGSEEHEAMGDHELEQEQIVRQKRS
jgi:F-type H+-transporting ATPase subunit alpha